MIRPLLESDYPSITQIYSTAFDLARNPLRLLKKSWAKRSEENSYGIFSDGIMAGFAVGSFHRRSANNMYLDYIAVDKAFQGRGFGTQLLNHLIQICKNEHRSIHLFPDSLELAAWYKTFGFYETIDTDPIKGKPPYYLNWSPYSRRDL